ncbi:MAG: hypothetical protein IJX75_03675 [Clostridia bacterium]|nr:hypothetical protein [Clostridia bacterium]
MKVRKRVFAMAVCLTAVCSLAFSVACDKENKHSSEGESSSSSVMINSSNGGNTSLDEKTLTVTETEWKEALKKNGFSNITIMKEVNDKATRYKKNTDGTKTVSLTVFEIMKEEMKLAQNGIYYFRGDENVTNKRAGRQETYWEYGDDNFFKYYKNEIKIRENWIIEDWEKTQHTKLGFDIEDALGECIPVALREYYHSFEFKDGVYVVNQLIIGESTFRNVKLGFEDKKLVYCEYEYTLELDLETIESSYKLTYFDYGTTTITFPVLE